MRLNHSRTHQAGIGLPVAIFIITIMGLIAAAVNQMGETSSQGYIQNVLSTRAFYAAESGAQLRAQSVLSATPCNCGADLTYTFGALVTGLNLCSAETSCTQFVANAETYCTIESIGRCDNSRAERTVEVRIK
jgi:MSHA biogenesis protein MshP